MEIQLRDEQIAWKDAFLDKDAPEFVHFTVKARHGISMGLGAAVAAYMLATPGAFVTMISATWTTQRAFESISKTILYFLERSETEATVIGTWITREELSIHIDCRGDTRRMSLRGPFVNTRGIAGDLLVLHDMDTFMRAGLRKDLDDVRNFCTQCIRPLMMIDGTRILSFSTGDGSKLREVLSISEDEV